MTAGPITTNPAGRENPPPARTHKSLLRWEILVHIALGLGCAVPMVIALGFAVRTPFALVDDYHHAPLAEVWSTFPRFAARLGEILIPRDHLRYRWAYEIFDAGLSWRLIGDQPAVFHAVRLAGRILTAGLCVWLLYRTRPQIDRFALWILVTVAFLHPIVPESRLAPQETMLTLCLLIACGALWPALQDLAECRIIGGGGTARWSPGDRSLFLGAFVLLCGSKETALPLLWLLAGVVALWMMVTRRRWWTGIAVIGGFLLLTTWHVWRVSRVSRYGRILQHPDLRVESPQRLAELILGWDIEPTWWSLLLVTALALFLAVLVRNLRQPEDRALGLFQAVIALATCGFLALHLRVYVTPRYVMPVIWLISLMVAWSVDFLRTVPWGRPLGIAWLAYWLIIPPLLHAPLFVRQFAVQAAVRGNESQLLDQLIMDGGPLFIDGLPLDRSSVEADEQVLSIRAALEQFRPRYGRGSAVRCEPVSQLKAFKQEDKTLVVTRRQADEWRDLIPSGWEIETVTTYAPDRFLRSMNRSEAWWQRHRQWSGIGDPDRYADAGAPPLGGSLDSPLTVWQVLEIRQVFH